MLAQGCAPRPWLWVPQGDKQSPCQHRAFCSAWLTAFGLAYSESPGSHWGSGKGLWGSRSTPRIFPIHGRSACHPEWSLLHSAGLGVWGVAVREPQGAPGLGHCQQCVSIGGRNVPFCVALAGGPEMESQGRLFFHFSWMFLSPPPREERPRAGQEGAQARGSARIP